jgi:hypothetical protein
MNVYDSKCTLRWIRSFRVLGLDRNGWVYVLFDCVLIGEAIIIFIIIIFLLFFLLNK